MAERRIDLPPVVTDFFVGLGRILGKHVLKGVAEAKASLMDETADALEAKAKVIREDVKRTREGSRSAERDDDAADVVEVDGKQVRRGK